MRLSAKTIEHLTGIITGDGGGRLYRSGPKLIEFFSGFGEDDDYRQGFPSRAQYVRQKLYKFNGTEVMEKIILEACDFVERDDYKLDESEETFNRLLFRDGYQLVIEEMWGRIGGRRVGGYPKLVIRPLLPAAVIPGGLTDIGHNEVNEQIDRANKRIETGDFAGAIASCYTLTEHLLKHILRDAGIPFNENKGDIRALYKLVREPLNLNPAGEGIAAPLKPILDGLQKLVSGLYETSNKASDRHARRYNPAAHHATLAVNTAFTLCEFLVESRDYQDRRDEDSTAA